MRTSHSSAGALGPYHSCRGAMVLARARSAAVLGIDAYVVEVETDIVKGRPSFATVGLPHGAVKEGHERVNAAITNSGLEFPLKRITVHLAPAGDTLENKRNGD